MGWESGDRLKKTVFLKASLRCWNKKMYFLTVSWSGKYIVLNAGHGEGGVSN